MEVVVMLCALLIKVIDEPASAMSKLNATLASGGPDGGFTLQRTAEHSLGFANLTEIVHKLPEPFHSSVQGVYIGQVYHQTSGPKHYNDSVSFNIIKNSTNQGSLIRAPSLSLS